MYSNIRHNIFFYNTGLAVEIKWSYEYEKWREPDSSRKATVKNLHNGKILYARFECNVFIGLFNRKRAVFPNIWHLYLFTINFIMNEITDTALLGPTPGTITFTKSGCCADQNERWGTSEGHFWLIDETSSLSETTNWSTWVTTKLGCAHRDTHT